MMRNGSPHGQVASRRHVLAPLPAPKPLEDVEPESGRGVCRVSFRPSATVLDGVGRLLAEFFSSQLAADVALSFSHVADDLLRGWVRPGLDQSARVRATLWPEQLGGVLEVQVSFCAPGDDPPRLLALVEQLGRGSGQFSYRLLPRAVGGAPGILVRAEGTVVTDVQPLAEDECMVTSTLRVSVCAAKVNVQLREAPPRAPGKVR